jgi:hypothetical protein
MSSGGERTLQRSDLGQADEFMRQALQWFFRNRETGGLTIAQAPNSILWIVIVAGTLLFIWPSAGDLSFVLTIVFKGGLVIWALDEIFRGVNPWRRCLGAAVILYEFATLFQ